MAVGEKIKRAVESYQDWEERPRRKILDYAEKQASKLPDYRKEGEEPPQALKRAQFDDLRWKAGELGSKYGDVRTMKMGGEDFEEEAKRYVPKTTTRKRRALKR